MKTLDETVDLGHREPCDCDVEFQVYLKKRLELFGQQIFIPSGVQCELIVGERIGPLLSWRHVLKANTRNLRHSQELGRLHPAVTGDNRVVAIQKDRVGEAKHLNTVGDLADLPSRMGARIAPERP